MKVFLTNLSDITDDLIHRYELLLSPADKDRYSHISNPNRRLQFLTGRALIYENCGEMPILSETGKLLISNGYISLSHSGPYVALITSDSPVGIDLEDSSCTRDFGELSERLNFPPTDRIGFYRHFTQYESDYKLGKTPQKIHHLFYSIDTFILCISILKNKDNIYFIKSIPFLKSTSFSPRILP